MTRAKHSFDQIPMFAPDSNWQPPTELPDLSNETEVAIDTETKDTLLSKDKGPGFYAYNKGDKTGYICGISAAWRDQAIYIPLQHYETNCFQLPVVASWLKSLASQKHTRFIFHNFQYDWGWIQAMFGLEPPLLLDDTAAMASMLNEELESFSLESLCEWQELPGKDESLLREVMANYNVKSSADIKKNLWQLAARFVGPYAEQDAMSTLALAQKLRPLLAEEELEYAYQIERDLFPVTLKMKQRGIKVDIVKTTQLRDQIHERCKDDLYKLGRELNQKLELKHIRSNRWLQTEFDKRNWKYPHTFPTTKFPHGQPSFDKEFMAGHEHPIPRAIHRIKHQTEMADKFLQNFILEYQHRNRVYPTVNQFRSESGGARSHRFSYADPALQQMPSRDDEWASPIRSCFIPEDGEVWCSIDYRQQEYRLIVYVAEVLGARGSRIAANRYRKDPSTDFHDYVAAITRLPRRRAKDVNFAKSYGAGTKKFALMAKMSEEEAETVMRQYDKELPFVREAAERFTRLAERGYIKMIDGARGHFNRWEPIFRDYARETEYKKSDPNISTSPCSQKEYDRRWDDPKHPWYGERGKLAFTHKAFNRMIQGSAARQIKKAMVDIYKAGFVPLLQLHDELAFSLTSKGDAKLLSEIMEQAAPMVTIPMTTDIEIGPSWGELDKIK